MAGNYHLNLKIDSETREAIVIAARERKIIVSALVRDLLRRGLALDARPYEAGYQAGRMEGYAAVRQAAEDAIRRVPVEPVKPTRRKAA